MLWSNGHIKVDEIDDINELQFNEEDYNWHDNDEIEEKYNSN